MVLANGHLAPQRNCRPVQDRRIPGNFWSRPAAPCLVKRHL